MQECCRAWPGADNNHWWVGRQMLAIYGGSVSESVSCKRHAEVSWKIRSPSGLVPGLLEGGGAEGLNALGNVWSRVRRR